MIRNTTNGDISDDEFEAVLKPFLNDYDNFIYSYVMPKIIAYYITNSFNQHYNFAKDLINMFDENKEKVKAAANVLGFKFILNITNENPLEIKKIEY